MCLVFSVNGHGYCDYSECPRRAGCGRDPEFCGYYPDPAADAAWEAELRRKQRRQAQKVQRVRDAYAKAVNEGLRAIRVRAAVKLFNKMLQENPGDLLPGDEVVRETSKHERFVISVPEDFTSACTEWYFARHPEKKK